MRSGNLRQNSFSHAAVHSFLPTWMALNSLQQVFTPGDLPAWFFHENYRILFCRHEQCYAGRSCNIDTLWTWSVGRCDQTCSLLSLFSIPLWWCSCYERGLKLPSPGCCWALAAYGDFSDFQRSLLSLNAPNNPFLKTCRFLLGFFLFFFFFLTPLFDFSTDFRWRREAI